MGMDRVVLNKRRYAMNPILIPTIILIVLVVFYIRSKSQVITRNYELSEVNKRECELTLMRQERNDYSTLVSAMLKSASQMMDCVEIIEWEKEFCQSIMRNLHLIKDARIPDTRDTFSHAINLLRANYKHIEKDYFNKTYFGNYKITQQLIYDCLDGDKEAIFVFYSSVMQRSMAQMASVKSQFKESKASLPTLAKVV